MPLSLLVVLLIVAVGLGGWGHSRYGVSGWFPAGLLLAVLLGFCLAGKVHN